jgi:hypothetical protein
VLDVGESMYPRPNSSRRRPDAGGGRRRLMKWA